MPLGAAFVEAVAFLDASLSFDLDEAAGFDSFEAVAGAVGVGEGDADATSFGSGVGVGEVAGACASAADAAVIPAANSRAINLRVFITFILWAACRVWREFSVLVPLCMP